MKWDGGEPDRETIREIVIPLVVTTLVIAWLVWFFFQTGQTP